MKADEIIFVLFLVHLFGSPHATAINSRKKLVIDHDGGADDAFAITLGLLNEKYLCGPNVVALTTTFGNVNLTQSVINSDRILALNNRQDVPIYSGANQALISKMESDYFYGYDGLGDDGYLPPETIELRKEHAAVALIDLSKKYEGDLIIIAIGPVTNIALAARMDPEFIGRLSQLYVGAGHIYSEKNSKPEFNARMDPEAYYIVADSAAVDKVTFIPYSQVYASLNITLHWRIDVLGEIQTPTMQALNGYEQISFPKETAWTQLDPAVAAMALNNDIIEEFQYTKNSIILEGAKRGINTNDFSSIHPNIRAVYTANKEKYKKFLMDLCSAELEEEY